jgi:hypothetical protein
VCCLIDPYSAEEESAVRSADDDPGGKQKKVLGMLLNRLALPSSVVIATVAMGTVFATFAPPPSAVEARERCERLISGSIRMGDRRGAEKWLSTCEMPVAEAEDLLSRSWLEQWGHDGPAP